MTSNLIFWTLLHLHCPIMASFFSSNSTQSSRPSGFSMSQLPCFPSTTPRLVFSPGLKYDLGRIFIAVAWPCIAVASRRVGASSAHLHSQVEGMCMAFFCRLPSSLYLFAGGDGFPNASRRVIAGLGSIEYTFHHCFFLSSSSITSSNYIFRSSGFHIFFVCS